MTMDKANRDRRDILTQMRQARTPTQIAAVERVVDAWLRDHPDDMAVRGEAEGLVMMKSALEELARVER